MTGIGRNMSWANLDDLGSLPEGHVKEGNALEKNVEFYYNCNIL